MNGLLLDTHVFIWYVNGNATLNKLAQKKIDAAIQHNELYLASISLWEVSMLAKKERIILDLPCLEWLNRALLEIRAQVLPITSSVAVESCVLPGIFHGDPADCLIVATTRTAGLTLLTRDSRILQYGKSKYLSTMRA